MKKAINNFREWYRLFVLLNSSADYGEIAKYDNTVRKKLKKDEK